MGWNTVQLTAGPRGHEQGLRMYRMDPINPYRALLHSCNCQSVSPALQGEKILIPRHDLVSSWTIPILSATSLCLVVERFYPGQMKPHSRGMSCLAGQRPTGDVLLLWLPCPPVPWGGGVGLDWDGIIVYLTRGRILLMKILEIICSSNFSNISISISRHVILAICPVFPQTPLGPVQYG